MKTKLAILLVGVALGYGLKSWLSPATLVADSAPAPVPAPAPVVEHAPEPARPQTQAKALTIAPGPTLSETRPRTAARTEPPATETDTTRGLILDEENIAEMERQGSAISDHAYATRTGEGWKIQLLPEDKLFLKAGLGSGDVITFESIDQQLQMPDRARLAMRFVAILNKIQR